MRIIKYAIIITKFSGPLHFVATQKVILMLKEVKLSIPKTAVYSFVNDYKTGKILKLDC
jgi:hypothetical protein